MDEETEAQGLSYPGFHSPDLVFEPGLTTNPKLLTKIIHCLPE
jgi:hypothetical protein